MKPLLLPIAVSRGDKVRFVSPASTPREEEVKHCAEQLSEYGFEHDFGLHAFSKYGPFAGSDQSRLDDLNNAFADDTVLAIFATRGGKGSYRIAESVDFDMVLRKPKWLVGFSDITVLQTALLRECGLPSIHGTLYVDQNGELEKRNLELLLGYITGHGAIEFYSDLDNPTARLTVSGSATGRMVGGNLDALATGAGWALPAMEGCILMLEAVDCQPGRIDRALTLLRKGGHINRVSGVVLGQFLAANATRLPLILDLVADHLAKLGVPVLGGLPFGHGKSALSVPLGTTAEFDSKRGVLRVTY